ncbi:MAG: conjugative relaxase [Phenylobacterium sp.]|nr:conjugative relaxase [Phenylobacterium sp.]
MLSHKILTRQDVGDVASYYGDGADDYYAKEGEAQTWQGRGAEMLGLTGSVDSLRFRELLAGKIDPGGAPVRTSTRDDSKSRIGVDLTFSAPKSVSIQALVGRDAALIAAHETAVERVLGHVEALAQARKKAAGVTRIERTGNLVIAKFRHETTRAQDPELHTHSIVMNLTRRADGEWRALKNDEIIARTRYLGVLYRTELARILEQQGYALRYGKDGTFELAAMSRRQIEAFSRRSEEIERRLAEMGLTRDTATAAQKQLATMQTRGEKPRLVDRARMFGEWEHRAAELGIRFERTSDRPTQTYDRTEAVAEALTGL